MALVKRIKYAYLFPNIGGVINVYDETGSKIPEFTQYYSIDLHRRILLEALDDCDFIGFDILPNGFNIEAQKIIEYRKQNLSWEEYKELVNSKVEQ